MRDALQDIKHTIMIFLQIALLTIVVTCIIFFMTLLIYFIISPMEGKAIVIEWLAQWKEFLH